MDKLVKLLVIPSIVGLTGGLVVSQSPDLTAELNSPISVLTQYRKRTLQEGPAVAIQQPTSTPTPHLLPTTPPSPLPKNSPSVPPQQGTSSDSSEWGIAKQVGEHTYTIKVGNDDRMATAQEVVDALNAYRATKGVSQLSVDGGLAQYAQQRAQYFKEIGTVDAHAGFNSFLENESGFDKLGYRRLGENSYYGDALTGTHLIEWVFSQSPGHDANQLDAGWSHVGVGVTDTSVNLIFGGEKM